MELNEEEKRQLFQVDGDCQAKVLDELYMTARFTRNPEQRDMVRGLMAKLRVLSDEQCMDLVKDIQKNLSSALSSPHYGRADRTGPAAIRG
ncbi:MAG: hypothetical protein ACLSWR_03455 [Ruthenibacterium sp.]